MPSPARRIANSRRTSTKNRRGQHILDVNVRAQQALRQRKDRMFGAVSVGLIFVCLGAALFFGGRKLVQRLFLKNPDYNLASVDVQTDGVLSPDAIAAAAQLQKGTNIFRVDLDGARARLSVIPEVEKVEVTRQLPNRVSIDVTERKPWAWVAPVHDNSASRDELVSSGKAYLIDGNGVIMPSKKQLPQNSHLPIIRGYTGPTTLGQKADGEEIWSALDLLHAHQDSLVASRYQIEEIDLSKHFALVVTDQNGSQTMLGLDDMNKQLKKMESILEAAEHRGQKVQTLNLLVENNTPVTFQPPPAPEPAIAPGDPAVTNVPPASSPAGKPASADKPKSAKKESASGKKSAPIRHKEEKASRPKLAKHTEASSSSSTASTTEVRRALPLQPFH